MASSNRLVRTAADKIQLHEEFKQSGLSIRKFSAERKLEMSFVCRIVRNHDKLKTWPSQTVRRRRSIYDDIDTHLVSWFNSELGKDGERKPTHSDIRTKADSLAKSLGYKNWTCRDGWYSRWKRRNGIIADIDVRTRSTATKETVTTASEAVDDSEPQIVTSHSDSGPGDSSPGDGIDDRIEQQDEEMFEKWQAASGEENSAHSGVERDSSLASSEINTANHLSSMVLTAGSTSQVADVIIKSEIDNETWMATLQSDEEVNEYPDSTSRASQPAKIIPPKTQKRPIETESPVSSSQPTEKRSKQETSKELDGFNISQLLSKLRGLIEEKNDELKRHAAEVEIHTRQHVKHMEDMNSREDDIVTAISQRIGV